MFPSSRMLLGRIVVRGSRDVDRGRSHMWSWLVSGAFAAFGPGSVLEPPIRLRGERRMAIGRRVWVGSGSWLHVLEPNAPGVALEIGDGCSLAGECTLAAAHSVRLGCDVLMARGVYVSDHSHAFDDPSQPVMRQGIARTAAVEIADGAWLGQNVVVCPGVRIGRGAVIGANAVVTADVPDHTVAAGAPARVLRAVDGVERARGRAA